MDKWTCKCQTPPLLNTSCNAQLIMRKKTLTSSSSSVNVLPSTFHMETYEDNVAIEVLIERETRQLSKELNLNRQTEVTDEHLDQVFDWLFDVVQENRCHPEIFALATQLTNRFLTECQIKVNQLQLLAVACTVLAGKIRIAKHPECSIPVSILVEYTDNSISEEEVKTWEKLILSKLDWDVNLVLPQDYLEPLSRQLQLDFTPNSQPGFDLKNDLIRNAGMATTLVQRSPKFARQHPPRLVACASIIIPIKACQSVWTRREDTMSSNSKLSEGGTSGEEPPFDFLRFLTPGLRHRLCILSSKDEMDLLECLNQMESILLESVPRSPDTSLSGMVTPPCSAQSSPFKVCSSSTPKSSRLPLRDESNLPASNFRRRLNHNRPLEEEVHSQQGEDCINKENNDSAIGMNASFASGSSPATGLSPSGRSPTTSSSQSGSAASSPDSGASSTSPKSLDGVKDLGIMLENASIKTSPKTEYSS